MYYKLKELDELGYTKKLITKYLGKEDKQVPNPMYRSAAPSRLYLKERVNGVSEKIRKELDDILSKRDNRRIGAKKATSTKKNKLLTIINNLEISIENIDNVQELAIASYNTNKGYNYADNTSDDQFLQRITVNYTRHELTNYDREIHNLFNKVGRSDGYVLLKNRVLETIGDKYPHLRKEALRQTL
jgi:hypothetical protein